MEYKKIAAIEFENCPPLMSDEGYTVVREAEEYLRSGTIASPQRFATLRRIGRAVAHGLYSSCEYTPELYGPMTPGYFYRPPQAF